MLNSKRLCDDGYGRVCAACRKAIPFQGIGHRRCRFDIAPVGRDDPVLICGIANFCNMGPRPAAARVVSRRIEQRAQALAKLPQAVGACSA